MPDSAFLFIHAITSVHPGSGTALGHVDLPIQRERHTDWPMIPGSSLKGVLRDALGAADRLSEEERLAVFGPDQRSAHEHAGAIALTDARILGFPVRSLAGVFAWLAMQLIVWGLA